MASTIHQALELGASPDCVVVGHSSGAVAALRLAERQKLKAGACYFLQPADTPKRLSLVFTKSITNVLNLV